MLTFESFIPSAPKQRFSGINRTYTPQEVHRLRGSLHIQHTLAEAGTNRLWALLHDEPFVAALGATTGNQAMQMVRAGLQCLYLSGWQVAADNNTAGAMYPDQSLYPSGSGPKLCRAGFGGNAHEITKAYIEAGAAGVHFEDQLASEKKCGHLGGKVLIPTAAHERNLNAARLAADICGVPTVVVARTDAESARLITSDIDERDREFLSGERTAEGFYRLKPGTGLAMEENMSTPISVREVVTPSWVVIALVGVVIIACAVFASLYGNVSATDLQIGP
jgi:isocitrate lyase